MKVDGKELKEIIKHYVRETLIEVLAESKIQTIVESAIKNVQAPAELELPRSSYAEIISPKKPHSSLVSNRKNRVLDELRLPPSAWASVYEDTANSGNSILSSDRHHADASPEVELVSENTMEDMGLMNYDFSKFINNKKTSTLPTSKEDEDLFKKRAEMLSSKIVK